MSQWSIVECYKDYQWASKEQESDVGAVTGQAEYSRLI